MTADADLRDLTWPEVPGDVTVLLPLGSHEQHGPHLPFDTDAVIASAVAQRAARRLRGRAQIVLVAPVLAYGASGEHQDFPGTISIGHEALRLVIIEMIRSLSTFAGRVIVINGHGGNLPTVRDAIAQMRDEGHEAAWIPCAFESAVDAHAGCDETSVMLHLDPSRVRMERAEPGSLAPLSAILPDLVAHGVRHVAPNGILGDPTTATATRGQQLLDALVTEVVEAVRDGVIDDEQRLVPVAGTRRCSN